MSGCTHDLEAPGGLNLAERIRRLANGRNTIDVAQFQFIGLKEIRASMASAGTNGAKRSSRSPATSSPSASRLKT